jgi:hypothetical protein
MTVEAVNSPVVQVCGIWQAARKPQWHSLQAVLVQWLRLPLMRLALLHLLVEEIFAPDLIEGGETGGPACHDFFRSHARL